MQSALNNILLEKGFLKLTQENPEPFEPQNPIKIQENCQVTLLDTGVLLVEPLRSDNASSTIDLVISSGVHGNETAPIEIVDQLVKDILSGELAVNNRVLMIIGNPVAMNKGERFDIENMNRLFNGKHEGKAHHEATRAAALESYVKSFYEAGDDKERRHYDLHTAIRASKYKKFAVYPYPDGRKWNKQQIEFFGASDIHTMLLGHQPSGTFSYFTSHQFNAHGFTVELGKVKPFGENDHQEFAAIRKNLAALIAGESVKVQPFNNDDYRLFQVKDEIVKHSDNFRLHIADDVENFTDFKKGFQLADDTDGGYIIEEDGDAIVFPNAKIPNGQRAGLIVRRTNI